MFRAKALSFPTRVSIAEQVFSQWCLRIWDSTGSRRAPILDGRSSAQLLWSHAPGVLLQLFAAYGLLFNANIIEGEGIMPKLIYVALVGLGLSACAATDPDYAGRNNMDQARAECLRLARSNGYSDVAVDSVERDGSAEWKVGLRMRRDGRDKTERCEYNARTDRAHIS
jgi:hypothetical protein